MTYSVKLGPINRRIIYFSFEMQQKLDICEMSSTLVQ
jgi:hypothetical protein